MQCWIQGLMSRGQGQGLEAQGQGQELEVQGLGLVNWSSRTRTFLEVNNTGLQLRMAYLPTYISKKYLTSIGKAFFTVSSCTVAVTELMDVT